MESSKEYLVKAINERGVLKASIREDGFVEIIIGDGTVFLFNPEWVGVNGLKLEDLIELQKKTHHTVTNEIPECYRTSIQHLIDRLSEILQADLTMHS